MDTKIDLTAEGEAFTARLTWAQARLMREALEWCSDDRYTDTAVAVRLHAGRGEVRRLADRLACEPGSTLTVVLSLDELHVIHAALTGLTTTFLSDRGFSVESFRERIGFFPENVETVAVSLVLAASAASEGGPAA
ncbi:hypothetical protein [Streptomyces yaizuensis]|uniref:MarR family transcriptional regulator n=1 Tax=Streptomyces yaizuensis TaxID=2989713 RepID=A0ABQ5NXZ9_9ACTN|nr:hypothetical protein [Streptomyces sp. YSPA8]GLF94836.1 hypothetical protein SYYSPA8_11085 [Streptomyces sp. YSPA8]